MSTLHLMGSLDAMTSVPGYDSSRYPPFAVTVDLVVFTVVEGRLQVVLVERGGEPFAGRLALPGGFVRPDEDLLDAAVRELAEETAVNTPTGHLEQFGAYGAPGRDPRMRVVTVGYWAIVPKLREPRGGSDAAAAYLVPVDEALAQPDRLAFDHHQILSDALERARRSLETTTVALDFCDPEFTISDLRKVYQAVWGTELDQGNFQNKVVQIPGFIVQTGRHRRGEKGRPPELYRRGDASEIDPPFRRTG